MKVGKHMKDADISKKAITLFASVLSCVGIIGVAVNMKLPGVIALIAGAVQLIIICGAYSMDTFTVKMSSQKPALKVGGEILAFLLFYSAFVYSIVLGVYMGKLYDEKLWTAFAFALLALAGEAYFVYVISAVSNKVIHMSEDSKIEKKE